MPIGSITGGEGCPARRSMTPSPPDVGSGTIVSAVVGLGSGDRAPPRCPSLASSTTFHAAPCTRCLSGELHCAAKKKNVKFFKLDVVTTATRTGGQGVTGLRWSRLRSARRSRAAGTAVQRSPTLWQLQNSFAAADALAHGQWACTVGRRVIVRVGRHAALAGVICMLWSTCTALPAKWVSGC